MENIVVIETTYLPLTPVHAGQHRIISTTVFRRYAALAEQLSQQAGSRMRIGPDGITSLAMQFLKERGFA